jgi:hypothetical protein
VKLLLAIFAFYLLLLPCVPCADSRDCDESAKVSLTAPLHEDDDHGDNGCAPFCACACCGQVVANYSQRGQLVPAKPLPAPINHSCNNNDDLPNTFLGNIWQPPRLH